MTSVSRLRRVDALELEALRAPRRDLLIEEQTAIDRWVQIEGPFAVYGRTLSVGPIGPDARHDVTEVTEFKLAIPLWGSLFRPMMKRALADRDRRPRARWWWGQEVIPAQTTLLLSVVAIISMVVGYLGVIIGQTITFATREFGADDADQGWTLAAVRIGVLLSVVLLRFADRVGR